MRTVLNIILAGALVLGFASCSKENGGSSEEPVPPVAPVAPAAPVTLKASIASEGGSKATLNEETGAFLFSDTTPKDSIKVFNGTGVYSSIDVTVSGSDATFTMQDGFADQGSGFAAFPARMVPTISGSGVTYTLPDTYTYAQVGGADPSTARVPCLMMATYTAGSKLTFKQAGAVIRFRITGCVAGSITFTFTSAVTGSATLASVPSGSGDGILAANLSNAGYSITVTGVPTTSEGYIYITLPVPTGTDPMNVGVWNHGESMNKVATLSGTAAPLNRADGRKKAVTLTDVKEAATFSGYHLEGYLYNYEDTKYGIMEDPLDILKYYSLRFDHNQYYFSWNDIISKIPTLFTSEGYQIGSRKYKAPSGGTSGEWRAIVGGGGARVTATINGIQGHGTFINVTDLSTSDYHTSSVRGLLLLPDGAIINVPAGATISALDNKTDTNSCTLSALQSLTDQGCVFFPCAGYYDGTTQSGVWGDIAVGGYYWSDTSYGGGSYAYALSFVYDGEAYSIWPYQAYDKKPTAYFPVRLIRVE